MYRKTGSNLAFFTIGTSLVVMALSMTSLAGSPLAKALLLGSGVLGLTVSLILLQLRFYREGDVRKARSADHPVPPRVPSAPRELKNPRLRTIWKNMEETRRLMKLREEKACEVERRREQIRLRLPEEEEILFMGDHSWLSLWPVALFSLLFVGASTVVSGVPSLLFLVIGLFGLLILATVNRLTRYYITNFRILVRRRSLLGREPQWRAIHYPDVHRCSVRKRFVHTRLKLEGEREAVDITGLNRPQFETVSRILRENLPEELYRPGDSS